MKWSEDRNLFAENPIVYITEGRIPTEKRKSNLHYYSIRHSDVGFEPAQISQFVWVNHMFDLAVEKPIEVSEYDDYLTDIEGQAIYDSFYK